MIHHHPADDLLLARAAGTLAAGPALLLDVHVETCAHCRTRLDALEAVGGALLEGLEPVPLAADAFASTLARIDALARIDPLAMASTPSASLPAPSSAWSSNASVAMSSAPPSTRSANTPVSRPPLPAGAHWPKALDGCELGRWRWLARGMRWSRVKLPRGADGNVFVLRIHAGDALPSHRHSDGEMTQVLYGSFDDGRSTFGPGDFDATDTSIRHEPTARAGSDCICLVSLSGKVVFDGTVARLWGALNGI